jgi:hypothetical protein
MAFLQRLFGFFRGSGGSRPSGRGLPIYVLSRRCNEPIAGQVDLFNELSLTDEGDAALYARKVLHTSGDRRCFDQVAVHLYFDSNKRLLRYEVEGGRWLEEEEYHREVERMKAEDAAREAEKAAAQAAADTAATTSTETTVGSNDKQEGA